MHIDCEICVARGPGCPDCVVSVILGVPGVGDGYGARGDGAPGDGPGPAGPRTGRPRPVGVPRTPTVVCLGGVERWTGEQADGTPLPEDLDADERRALGVLAAAGLVPGLTLAPEVRRAG